jgi:hypothetical protein
LRDTRLGVRDAKSTLCRIYADPDGDGAYRAVDYHVTQVVDGTKGIHGMIPKAIFTSQ